MKNYKFLKTKPLLVLLITSAVSLVYLYYSIQTSPQKPIKQVVVPSPTPSDIHSGVPAINSRHNYAVMLTFASFEPNHPNQLKIYEANIVSSDINSLGQSLINYFKLNTTSNESLYQSTDKTKNLTINYKQQRINYSYSPKNLPVIKNTIQSSVEKTASDFVSSIVFFKNLSLNSKQTQPLLLKANDPHFETNAKNNANYYNLFFSYFVDSYPYYQSAEVYSPLQIMIGPSNSIYKLSYLAQPEPNINEIETKRTLTYDETVSLLSSGKGEVVNLNILDTQYNTDSLPDITITDYQIEYRYNPVKKLVVPYYRFSGHFLNQLNQESPIDIILPAVEL